MRSENIKPKTFAKLLLENIMEHRTTDLSAQSAYFLILALFPFLIVIFNIITMLASNYIDEIMTYLEVLPEETYDALQPIILSILSSDGAGIISISIIIAFWSSSKGMLSIHRAMNVAFGVVSDKGFIQTQLKGLLFTFLLLLLIIAVLASLVFGEVIIQGIESFFSFTFHDTLRFLIDIVRFFIPFLGMILGFSFILKKGPDFPKDRGITFRSAFLGGILTTFGWLLISWIYSYYVSNISSMNVTYGPLVGIMALFIWLNLSSMIILFVSEFIAIFDRCVVRKMLYKKRRTPNTVEYY